MPKRPETTLPKPRKARNSLVTYVDGKRYTFGKWGDPAALKKFAEFFENRQHGVDNNPPPDSLAGSVHAGIPAFNGSRHVSPKNGSPAAFPHGDDYPLIADLVAAYLPYAKEQNNNWREIRAGCKALLRFADLSTAEFDAAVLLELQNEFVKRGYKRGVCDMRIRTIMRIFRWGESRRLVPAGKYHHLQTIETVPFGMAPESEERQDVPYEVVERTLPYLLPMYQAFIRILMATGARPSEILRMRVGDIEKVPEIDTKNSVSGGKCAEKWLFCPKNHKTAKKNKRRIIVFGAKEQSILAPYFDKKPPNSVIFSPQTVILEYYKMRRSKKKTPITKHDKQREEWRTKHGVRGSEECSAGKIANMLRNAIIRRIGNCLPINRFQNGLSTRFGTLSPRKRYWHWEKKRRLS